VNLDHTVDLKLVKYLLIELQACPSGDINYVQLWRLLRDFLFDYDTHLIENIVRLGRDLSQFAIEFRHGQSPL
jgi:hypothetical protein